MSFVVVVVFFQIKVKANKNGKTKRYAATTNLTRRKDKKQLQSFFVTTIIIVVSYIKENNNTNDQPKQNKQTNKNKNSQAGYPRSVTFTHRVGGSPHAALNDQTHKEHTSCDCFRKLPVQGNAVMESSVTMTTIIDDMPVSASRLSLDCIVSRLKVTSHKRFDKS